MDMFELDGIVYDTKEELEEAKLFSNIASIRAQYTCPICMSVLGNNDPKGNVVGFPCERHYFCCRCMLDWMHTAHPRRNEDQVHCPLCLCGEAVGKTTKWLRTHMWQVIEEVSLTGKDDNEGEEGEGKVVKLHVRPVRDSSLTTQ